MFTKDHPYYPTKNGMPGRTKAGARAVRLLASAVRDHVSADALVGYHFAIVCGHMNVRLSSDGEGVTWDDRQGVPYTNAEITASVNWLADRGHGLPVQALHLEANFRAEQASMDSAFQPGAMPASTMHAIRELIRARLPAGAPPDTSGGTPGTPAVIDAEFSEVTDPDRPA